MRQQFWIELEFLCCSGFNLLYFVRSWFYFIVCFLSERIWDTYLYELCLLECIVYELCLVLLDEIDSRIKLLLSERIREEKERFFSLLKSYYDVKYTIGLHVESKIITLQNVVLMETKVKVGAHRIRSYKIKWIDFYFLFFYFSVQKNVNYSFNIMQSMDIGLDQIENMK